jgi:phospholipase/carboxylesterase
LDEFLADLPALLGFRPGPLVLGGFSQGGTTSLVYALTRPRSVDGVVNLSGFLVGGGDMATEPVALGNTPLFWGHGTHDPAVPFALAVRGWARLQQAGVRMETRSYPMGHWVTPEEMQDLKNWLSREVPGWSRTKG